jgi:hypothetical protein
VLIEGASVVGDNQGFSRFSAKRTGQKNKGLSASSIHHLQQEKSTSSFMLPRNLFLEAELKK